MVLMFADPDRCAEGFPTGAFVERHEGAGFGGADLDQEQVIDDQGCGCIAVVPDATAGVGALGCLELVV